MDGGVVAESLERKEGEGVVRDLQLLQAQHVRLVLPEPAEEPLLARADRVDVPGRELHQTIQPPLGGASYRAADASAAKTGTAFSGTSIGTKRRVGNR